MIVLDTNVLSELMRPNAADPVARWISDHFVAQLFITTVTQAEIYLGIELLPPGRRKSGLLETAERFFAEDFSGRILPFDEAAAVQFGRISAARRSQGRPVSDMDAQIAAIAFSMSFAVATRNVPDFENCGVTIIDPWRHKAAH